MDLFSNPMRYIPELKTFQEKGKPPQTCGSIGPGLGSEGSPAIDLDLHGVTVKQILDSAAIADSSTPQAAATRVHPPIGWVLRVRTDPVTGKSQDAWSFLVSAPRNWRALLAREKP